MTRCGHWLPPVQRAFWLRRFIRSTPNRPRGRASKPAARHCPDGVELCNLPPFYQDATYIEALAALVTQHADPHGFDHVLMSYHGLPERHLQRADPTGSHCLASADCCEQATVAHQTCYRHQARVTSALLAARLGLSAEQHTVCYQSRLGRLPWLTPYTDQTIERLAAEGTKRLLVLCPAFVADNLETLEEIGLTAKDSFLAAGGEELSLVPCLNDNPNWIATLRCLCLKALSAAA